MKTSELPKSAMQPSEDGIYWVRWADREYVYDDRDGKLLGDCWKTGEWELVRIEDRVVDCFGTDEIISWNGAWHIVVEVGPKVERPE